MEHLQSLRQLETANRMMRGLVIAVLLAAVAIIGFTFYKSQETINLLSKSVYVPVKGESFERLYSKNYKENRPAEIRNHLRMFHDYMFTMVPDEKFVKNNIENKAIYLADKSALEFYKSTVQKQLSNLLNYSACQLIDYKSIIVDSINKPYRATVLATLTVLLPNTVSVREIQTQCFVDDFKIRSENNPHALMIRDWTVKYSQAREYPRRKTGL
jgi:conjugative transposon TraK protein